MARRKEAKGERDEAKSKNKERTREKKKNVLQAVKPTWVPVSGSDYYQVCITMYYYPPPVIH